MSENTLLTQESRNPLPRRWHVAWLVVVFFLTLAPVWPYLDFPYFYHADEPTKVYQLISGDWNFHHPVLMLQFVNAAQGLTGTPLEQQAVVELGRKCSAIFMAGAVVVMVSLAMTYGGLIAGIFAGLLFCVQPDVFELAHYLKEDPFLALGVAFTLWGVCAYARRPCLVHILLAGGAAGMAASGKYMGALFLLPVIGIVLWQGPAPMRIRMLRCGAALLAGALVFGIINIPMIANMDTVRSSFERETKLVIEGQAGIAKDLPHSGFVRRFLQQTRLLLPLYIAGIFFLWRGRRRIDAGAWIVAATPWLVILALSFSAKDAGRYFLPAILGIWWTIGLGCAASIGWLGTFLQGKNLRHGSWIALTIVAFYAGGIGLERFEKPWEGYRSDSRRNLLLYINEKLPPEAVIIQGRKVHLPSPDNRFKDGWHILPRREMVTAPEYVSDVAESPAALRGQGYTHVAMSSEEFGRYLKKGAKPVDDFAETFERRLTFYHELFTNGEMVWEAKKLKIGTHNPYLVLIRLPEASPTP